MQIQFLITNECSHFFFFNSEYIHNNASTLSITYKNIAKNKNALIIIVGNHKFIIKFLPEVREKYDNIMCTEYTKFI